MHLNISEHHGNLETGTFFIQFKPVIKSHPLASLAQKLRHLDDSHAGNESKAIFGFQSCDICVS